ncbi:MAG: peptidase M35 [Thermoanaerobaculia bacterium]|nr:peptidase M35 [Thermoanaerobaculia bacterium]
MWQTPFEGVDDDLFTVTRNGEPVTYLGRHVKRPAPTVADYVVLKPGESRSAEVELSALYDLRYTGEYSVQYNHVLQSLTRGAEVETASNAISFWVEGETWVPANEPEPTADDVSEVGTRALTPSFVSCSSSRQSSIISALSNSETYSANAYSYLQSRTTTAQRNASTRYKTWFGTQTSSRWSSAQSHFLNIRNTIQTKTITFDCTCTDNYYAYVYPNSPYRIYLCNAFWSAPTTGTDSKAGTIVHELSHFNVVAGTDDWAYGQTACKSLATSNPSRAVDNADSHEYFAENTPSLP